MFGAVDSLTHTAPVAPSDRLRWQWSRMPELAVAELYAVLAARQQVFAVEQKCAFQDADGHDLHAWHLLCVGPRARCRGTRRYLPARASTRGASLRSLRSGAC